ncbi:MAG: M20/M25/M40 family metallo-hydrolase [Melioribacteraceae bacterium]|nr:M20/M25/M40 family metallo-hydrolase [Melioribacteraceae bacterium]
MSKRFLSCITIFLISYSLIFSGDLVRLAKVELGDSQTRNQLETLQLKIVDIDKTHLTTTLDDEDVVFLNQNNIVYDLLSEVIGEDELFMLSQKRKNRNSIKFDELQRVHEFENFSLVRAKEQPSVYSADIRLIPLVKNNSYFKNEKVRYNSVQSDALDELINSIITEINAESVRGYIQGLQDFGTRFLRHPNRKEVSLWIKNQFELMGYTDVVLDSFMVGSYRQYNVVATYPATTNSEKVIVIGGHHDSITSESLSDVNAPAPGADDNASGTTAVLETARAIMNSNFESEVTIKFVTFAAEELGLYGAFDYAGKAADAGMDIKFMINHDMISNTSRSLENSLVNVNYYTGSEVYRDLALTNLQKFSAIGGVPGNSNSASSDSYPFYSNGFNVVYFAENDFSNYYHSSEDLIDRYSMEYCAEVIKASAATLITGAIAPDQVSNFDIVDAGDGSTLELIWDYNTEPDVVTYKIQVGTSEGVYTQEYETTENTYSITGLSEGQAYYVGISAVDADGYESFTTERSKIPYSIPLAPSDFTVEPIMYAVNLSWSPNEEQDLAGYNIYRGYLDSEDHVKINDEIITETQFNDHELMSGVYYEYIVKAIDTDGNESESSEVLTSRAVTLDGGILLVDETTDGDGSIQSPTDDEVDDFYNSILSGYQKTNFDLQAQQKIGLADLGAYSAVIWHGDDKTDHQALQFVDEIKKYLDFGGNFLYSGFRPSKTFDGTSNLSEEFDEGDFIYDYLKIDWIKYNLLAKFKGVIGVNPGYNSFSADENKLQPDSDFHFSGVEAIVPQSNAIEMFQYDSDYQPPSPQGALRGMIVGVEYLGEDFKL